MAGKQIGATLVLRDGNFFTNIKRAQQGAENFKNKLGGATSKAKEHGKSIDSLARSVKNLAAGYLSFQGLQAFTSFSDNLLSSAARLDLVNDGLQTSNELNSMIYDSAERSRSSYQSVADLVSRLGSNAKGAFESTEELVGFAEQINKMFIISGANSSEAHNAVIQLSQGLAAGALRGEELNSVLEQAPLIARTIENHMGLAEGTIKTAASKGLVTADVVKKAVMGAAEETDEKFSQIPVTFAQVATIFKDQMQEAVTPMIQEHIPGITQTLNDSFPQVIEGIKTGCEGAAAAIGFVRDNWSWLGPVIYGVVGAITAYNVITGIQNGLTAICAATTGLSAGAFAGMTITELAATAATTALGAAFTFLTSPITLIALGIGLLIAGFVLLWKKCEGFRNFWKATWEVIKVVFSTVWNGIKIVFSAVWEHIKIVFSMAVNHIKGIFNFWMAVFKGDWSGAWEAVKGIFSNVWEGIKGVFTNAFNALNEMTGGRLTAIGEQIKGIFGGIKSFISGVWNGITNGAKTMVNGVIRVLNTLIRGANRIQFDLPDILGGGHFGLNIPEIPMLAKGGIIQRSGSVLVGEKGPEILNLNRGASVVPLDRAGTATTTNHNTFYFTIHAGGLNDDVINEFVGKVKFALANM